MNAEKIFESLGIKADSIEPVHGGDISQAYCVYSGKGKYFLKTHDTEPFPNLFATEANGLKALKRSCKVTVPHVVGHGHAGSLQYLALEWLEKNEPQPDFHSRFGANIALMHRVTQDRFGFREDNYIGSLTQTNTLFDNWQEFFSHCRILPLIKELSDRYLLSENDVASTERFCKRIDEIFPIEPPALLHGDLWNGNYSIAADGQACIFDPAVYYGHREMDIGMTKLFGGFHNDFYTAYDEVYPLEKGWQRRLAYAQLYPLLVHAILFGGYYIGQVKEILSVF